MAVSTSKIKKYQNIVGCAFICSFIALILSIFIYRSHRVDSTLIILILFVPLIISGISLIGYLSTGILERRMKKREMNTRQELIKKRIRDFEWDP
jgi:hypothetical protein